MSGVKIDTYQIITSSGRVIDFQNVDPYQIDLGDLARGLANVCRYSGQVQKFYSVAEHTIMVARHAPLELKRHALLHDAAEAYIGDVPRPVKLLCPEYNQVEAAVEDAIAVRFGLPTLSEADRIGLKGLDNAALLLEARSLKIGDIEQWLDVPGEPLPDTIRCWTPKEAEEQWLDCANFLGIW